MVVATTVDTAVATAESDTVEWVTAPASATVVLVLVSAQALACPALAPVSMQAQVLIPLAPVQASMLVQELPVPALVSVRVRPRRPLRLPRLPDQ